MSNFKKTVAVLICVALLFCSISVCADGNAKIEVADKWMCGALKGGETLTVSLLLDSLDDTKVNAIAAIYKDGKLLQTEINSTGKIIYSVTKRVDITFDALSDEVDESCTVKVFLWKDLIPSSYAVTLNKDDIITQKEYKNIDFENNDFVLNTDYELGGGYHPKNISLSQDVDHTTGSGKSLKLDNITSKSHRIKFMNVFDKTDLGKTFKITFWAYTPLDGDFSIKAGGYGIL